MAALNGSVVLLYADGECFAMQKNLSIALDVNLPDASNKQSGGWSEHISGMINAKIDFNALFAVGFLAGNPVVLSARDLMDYIFTRKSIIVSILGGAYPIVGQADLSSLSFDAPMEDVMKLSGSLKINGKLWVLSATVTNLVTDPDDQGTDYDTLTISGTSITSAINAAGDAYSHSNIMTLVDEDVVRCFFFLTKTSGELPTVSIIDLGVGYVSNTYQTVEGLNVFDLTLTSTPTNDAALSINNTGAASWKVSPIYLFKL